MKEDTNFDYTLIKDVLNRFNIEMIYHIKDKIIELISMNYMMKNIEIDKLHAFVLCKLFSFYHDEIQKIESVFEIELKDINTQITQELIKVLDTYFSACFNQAVLNNKLNDFMEIYFFLLEISKNLFEKMQIDQMNVFIKYENGIRILKKIIYFNFSKCGTKILEQRLKMKTGIQFRISRLNILIY
jgi:hypothetical protein